ncbi:MAG: ribulose-phosphate 3-epimerase [Actinomycetes bacterium]
MSLRISPSILSADFGHLIAECERVGTSADWIHVDVMDNHFVPNLTLGLPIVESLIGKISLPIDCHLMISDADRWAPGYAEAGAQSVTFHVEAAANPLQVAKDIRAQGARAGMALKPGTSLDDYVDLLPHLDMILIMTVEPGFGGQSFMADQMSKVRKARELIKAGDLDVWIQVDGGVSAATIQECADAGADTFVAGSAVYQSADPAKVVTTLRELADAATSTSWWCAH